MKTKTIKALRGFAAATVLTLSLGSFTATAQTDFNENQLIGKSHSVTGLSKLLSDYRQNGWDVNAAVVDVIVCKIQGYTKTVVFTAKPPYVYPNDPELQHAPALPIVIATVEFDCENNIIASSLNN